MTDEKILESLQNVLDEFHTRSMGNMGPEERKAFWINFAHNKSVSERDARFVVSGKDIYEQNLGDMVSCTGRTKLFLYTARNSGLDLKAVITTDVECLNNGHSNQGHVVPGVKMSDGEYHIFEPCCHNVKGRDFQNMLKQSVAPGVQVFHVLNSIKDKPYEVVDIISGDELEKITTMDGIIQKSRRKNSV